MDYLQRIIAQMNKEETRFFKIYSTRMIEEKGRKDLKLFDKMRGDKADFSDAQAALKIYGKTSSSYYRLKHRLFEDLNSFTVVHNLEKSPVQLLYRDWFLFQVFLGKKEFDIAAFYLKKAESRAAAIENWELLDLIYNSYIRLSEELIHINPEKYIAKQSENELRLRFIRRIDQTIATLRYRLKRSQNLSRSSSTLPSFLNKTLREFMSDEEVRHSKNLQIRIYQAVSQVLLQAHRYEELATYLLTAYQDFSYRQWFDKSNHNIKLQMLTYLANSFYRTGNYDQSIFYSNLLGEEIVKYNKQFYDRYVFFYYNALVLNYMKSDIKKALTLVEKMEAEMKLRKLTYYDQFIYVNKAIAYHWLAKPDIAIRNMVKLYVMDSFKKADEGFRFKIMVAELIMQIDSGDAISYQQRAKQIRKEFEELLTKKPYQREMKLLNLMDYLQAQNFVPDIRFKKDAGKFIVQNTKYKKTDDEEIIDYAQWLSKKIGDAKA